MPISRSSSSTSGAPRRLVQKIVIACGLSLATFGEREIVLLAQMALGDAFETGRGVILDDRRLHVVQIGRHQPEALDLGDFEDLVEREHRGAGRDAGGFGDAGAQALVGVESQPARRGAVPGDGLHFRMR